MANIPKFLIRWMERIEAGLPPLIFGDGCRRWISSTYARHRARQHRRALAPTSDRVYNVAWGTEVSLKQLADTLLGIMGRPDLASKYQEARAINPVERRLADVTRARDELGFTATITLEDGLRDLVAWVAGRARP